MYRSVLWMLVVIAGVLVLHARTEAEAQERVSVRPYTGMDASAEAYYRAETKRRAEFAQHVGMLEYVRWLNGRGIPMSIATLYPADRAAYYAFGGRSGYAREPRVFERWPYLPGDVWGFSYGPPAAPAVKQRGSHVPAPVTTPPSRPATDAASDAAEPISPGPISY